MCKCSHPCLLVSLLDGVACDGCVAIIRGFGPFQGDVETPCICDLNGSGWARQLCGTDRVWAPI